MIQFGVLLGWTFLGVRNKDLEKTTYFKFDSASLRKNHDFRHASQSVLKDGHQFFLMLKYE